MAAITRQTIKRYLQRKTISAQELANAYLATLYTWKSGKQIIDGDELAQIQSKIGYVESIKFKTYEPIYRKTLNNLNAFSSWGRWFIGSVSRGLASLVLAMGAEQEETLRRNQPRIMTPQQYEEALAAEAEKEGKELISFKECLLRVVSHIVRKAPRGVPWTIEAAIDTAKQEPIANPSLREGYCRYADISFIEFADGRRSDEMTEEEALATKAGLKSTFENITVGEKQIPTIKAIWDGPEFIREAFKEATGEEPAFSDDELMEALETANGWEGSIPIKGEALAAVAQAFGFDYGLVAVFPDEPPKGTTKYDALLKAGGFYVAHYDEFGKDYPQLFTATKQYIEAKVPGFRKLKASQHAKGKISAQELAAVPGIIGEAFKDKLANPTSLADVAVFPKQPRKEMVDKNGDFKEPAVAKLIKFKNLEDTAKDVADIEMIKSHNLEMVAAISTMLRHNNAMSAIGEVYDLKDALLPLYIDITHFQRLILDYNERIYRFYTDVSGKDAADKKKKRQIIKQLFEPIDPASIKARGLPYDEMVARLEETKFQPTADSVITNL